MVVENFRPGVMDRLGLGPEVMTHANPGLVYCSIPGFASDDPRAAMPAFEGVVAGASATMRPPDSSSPRPVYTAIPIASVYGAFQSVVAIVIALNARERDGAGQRIEVPLFDSMFQSIGRFGVRVHNAPPSVPTLQELWGGIFQCSDGEWVRFGGSGNQNFRQFVEAAGITAWDAEGLTDFNRPLIAPGSAPKRSSALRSFSALAPPNSGKTSSPRRAAKVRCAAPARSGSTTPTPGSLRWWWKLKTPSTVRCCSRESTPGCPDAGRGARPGAHP